MPMVTTRAGRRFHSTCRTKHPTRPHPCSPEHAGVVEAYHLWREVEMRRAEAATLMYDTELDEYWLTHQHPTFRAYLHGTRRTS